MQDHLSNLFKEIKLLGFSGTISRIIFELKRRLGVDMLLMRPRDYSSSTYRKNCSGDLAKATSYLDSWLVIKQDLGLASSRDASVFLRGLLTTEQQAQLVGKAKKIASGNFLEFGHNWVAYGKVDWYCHPVEGRRWPKDHSSKLLLKLSKYGDIKLVWEVARFTWVLDLVRAWLVSKDDSHIDCLFELIDDFILYNPLYVGPQWTSEQEVAIRALMLVYVQEVLRDQQILTANRLLRLHTLLEAHGTYLSQNLHYAERAVRNNHLIYGALGLFVISSALPWYKKAPKWRERARLILTEATKEQWFSDGGYVQPSHNYHRSAWHGMLWARMVASKLGETDLVACIDSNLQNSLHLFVSQINSSDGRLPNWGPNDGALVGSWTECDYSDFRPLVQTLSLICRGSGVFESGPWDEEAFWFLGYSETNRDIKVPDKLSLSHFERQGLVVIRQCDSDFTVMRSGDYLSRYGQQADQLNVDIWSGGRNIAVDAGSYNYNRNIQVHNWFRGSLSHNTVIVAESDQMVPHRTFKYLNWAKGFSKELCFDNGHSAIIGVHQGYRRLPGQWCHARVMTYLDDTLVILDRLWPFEPTDSNTKLRLHWQFDLNIEGVLESPGLVDVDCETHKLMLFCSNKTGEFSALKGSLKPFDGWVSRYYNSKMPAQAMSYSTESNNETWFLTAVSQSSKGPIVSLCDKYIEIDGAKELEFEVIRNSSNQMVTEIALG
ncbi:heparinase II/III family protein [Gammaproteobacteria bacterium]|nr:heparinase II/III family protein [Gammaproteobacteria bacterium]